MRSCQLGLCLLTLVISVGCSSNPGAPTVPPAPTTGPVAGDSAAPKAEQAPRSINLE